MKKRIGMAALTALFLCFAATASADWRTDFIQALDDGKTSETGPVEGKGEGLAYTPTEESVLAGAIFDAVADEAPTCEVMRLAIEKEYNPYLVIKNIFGVGGNLELDQVCGCATDQGVMKAVIAKAALDAVGPGNKPVYQMDEVAQSQCLGDEVGLAFTEAATVPPAEIAVPEEAAGVSASAP